MIAGKISNPDTKNLLIHEAFCRLEKEKTGRSADMKGIYHMFKFIIS